MFSDRRVQIVLSIPLHSRSVWDKTGESKNRLTRSAPSLWDPSFSFHNINIIWSCVIGQQRRDAGPSSVTLDQHKDNIAVYSQMSPPGAVLRRIWIKYGRFGTISFRHTAHQRGKRPKWDLGQLLRDYTSELCDWSFTSLSVYYGKVASGESTKTRKCSILVE